VTVQLRCKCLVIYSMPISPDILGRSLRNRSALFCSKDPMLHYCV